MQCYASRTLACLYMKLTPMSHRPRYHYTTVDLRVWRTDKYASGSLDLGGKKENTKDRGTHISFRSTTSTSWNLTSLRNEDGAYAVLSLCHSRCVVVFRVRVITTARSRTLQEMQCSFLRGISTASLWDWWLWRQWGKGMRACVRTEPTAFYVVSDLTYYNTLFILLFSGVFAWWWCRPVHGWRLLAASLPVRDQRCEDGDASEPHDSAWSLAFYRVQSLCAV